MTALAGMIDRVDQEIGRLVADIKAKGELDNTVILFFSDNGACPYDRNNSHMDSPPYQAGTTWTDSTGWAWVRNTPFQYYKQNQFEGGISTPAIVHWPAGLKTKAGSVDPSPAHLVDVLPTLADLAGAKIPDTWPGREPTPLAGISLKPILEGGKIASRPPIHLLYARDRGLRDGDWKIVSFQQQPWELYHISEDRTELHDLATAQPERMERMVKQWHEMTEKLLMAPKNECAPVAATPRPKVHREWTRFDKPLSAKPSKKR